MVTTRLLNIDIQCITQRQLLESIKEGVLYTPNVDHMVELQHNRQLYDAYQQAEWIVCDSRILQLFSQFLKTPIPEAIPGSGFFPSFYHYHKDDPDCKIFLLGAAPGIALKAQEEINKTVGREMVIGAHSPSFGFEKNEEECEKIVDMINASQATVLVVGVGAPKQELWICKYRNRMPHVKIFMALGATIDFEAKTLKRAPQIWQDLRLEWLYRLIQEPERLFKRYILRDTKFFGYFLKQCMGEYRNPFA